MYQIKIPTPGLEPTYVRGGNIAYPAQRWGNKQWKYSFPQKCSYCMKDMAHNVKVSKNFIIKGKRVREYQNRVTPTLKKEFNEHIPFCKEHFKLNQKLKRRRNQVYVLFAILLVVLFIAAPFVYPPLFFFLTSSAFAFFVVFLIFLVVYLGLRDLIVNKLTPKDYNNVDVLGFRVILQKDLTILQFASKEYCVLFMETNPNVTKDPREVLGILIN